MGTTGTGLARGRPLSAPSPAQDHLGQHPGAGRGDQPVREHAVPRGAPGHHQPRARGLRERRLHVRRGHRQVLPPPLLPGLRLQEAGAAGEGTGGMGTGTGGAGWWRCPQGGSVRPVPCGAVVSTVPVGARCARGDGQSVAVTSHGWERDTGTSPSSCPSPSSSPAVPVQRVWGRPPAVPARVQGACQASGPSVPLVRGSLPSTKPRAPPHRPALPSRLS